MFAIFRQKPIFLLCGITFGYSLLLLSVTVKTVFTNVLVPACAFPILRKTEFCTIVIKQHFHPSNSQAGFICLVPLANRLFCAASSPGTHVPRQTAISHGLEDHFSAYRNLIASSSATPTFGKEIREIVLSLDDMTVLLKATQFKNKDAVLAHLRLIRRASRDSARRLQRYSSKLLSSISLILTSSEFIIEVAQGTSRDIGAWVPWISRRNPEQLQDAFLHTIKTFDTLNRHLAHLNGETQEAISMLDAYIEVLVDLIYDDALADANRELGEILNYFWTQLGGHRARIIDARERIRNLERIGQGSRLMRAFVLDVHLQLEKLQSGAEELRAQAAEPLLIDSPIPIVNIVESLRDGCQMLRTELWITTSRLELEASSH